MKVFTRRNIADLQDNCPLKYKYFNNETKYPITYKGAL